MAKVGCSHGVACRFPLARKPELRAAIVGHLRTHPLSAITFRTLSDALGVPADEARDEARVEAGVVVDQLYGCQRDLVLSRDDAAATAALERALHAYRERVAALIAAALAESSRVTESRPWPHQ